MQGYKEGGGQSKIDRYIISAFTTYGSYCMRILLLLNFRHTSSLTVAINSPMDSFSVLGSRNIKVLGGKETLVQVTPEVLGVTEDFKTFSQEVGYSGI